MLLNSLVRRLARCQGAKELDDMEKSLIRLVEDPEVAAPHAEAIKELAIELVVTTMRNVRNHPDTKSDLEDIDGRRTQGRSENPDTLEEQLQSGLEDSFPASDPPAVVSTSISGVLKTLSALTRCYDARRKLSHVGTKRARSSFRGKERYKC
ncbi:hypothetical protein ACVDG5_036665 [Mesorhizobium sp. ORM6]